jgi:class 3 adenylate cyclase/tetratricopeptide (TPR) repeat protein
VEQLSFPRNGHVVYAPGHLARGTRVTCPSCGTANAAGAKFCSECGTRFATTCPACGAVNLPGAKFCSECGTQVTIAPSGPQPQRTAPLASEPAGSGLTERRLVSILFADLVGFTARSDGEDPEQVREFLDGYFRLAREIVERYGGTVEKFIGDAVMAVWGAPVAQEDDAERAVRTALDLVDAVRHLGRQAGDDGLALRAGVLTGEAAVDPTAFGRGQAMVAGDLVNTASRLQSVALPGVVLVGESTRRAAERAIAFEPVGDQVLKGKLVPVPAFRALRVVAERGGANRSEGVEAPFVGRDDELRLLKDFFHATGRERQPRLISVTGQAGVGKSRLAWEFLKYIDGVLETIYWHEGRSPAFGEGVTFWALAEMVRRRAGLAERDDEATTREHLAQTLMEFVPDPGERERLEPALLALLGVGAAAAGRREELFAAWRTFFERVASEHPAILLFEDLQWADPGLMDFIDHLMEWANGPIYVVTLARPDLLERRQGWGAARRNFVALSLGPLQEDAMRDLLAGLAPDLPERTVHDILARAGGIPLYAVELVRMLAADGHLVPGAGGTFHVAGELGDLHVPETLHALIAARLDALEPGERSILQDAAVLGLTFSLPALAALTGDDAALLEGRLRSLVRREILRVDTDPRSPERGQHGFTQALLREVTYGTLAKRDRRAKHLAAARYFEALGDEAVAGMLATHYLDAYLAAPDGAEGEAIAGQARIALRAAADRASALGSHEQAIAFLERARSVTPDPGEEAELIERIAVASDAVGRVSEAASAFSDAIARHRARGNRVAAARATAGLGEALLNAYESSRALDLLRPAEAEFSDLAPDPSLVAIRAQISRGYMLRGEWQEAVRWGDLALIDAERGDVLELVAHTLITKGSALASTGRWREGTGLMDVGRRLAEENGLWIAHLRAIANLGAALAETDPRAGVAAGRSGWEVAKRHGYQRLALTVLGNTLEISLLFLGDWSPEARELAALHLDDVGAGERATLLGALRMVRAFEEPGVDLSEGWPDVSGLDPAIRSGIAYDRAVVALAAGDFGAAAESGRAAASLFSNAPNGTLIAARAAARSGNRALVAEMLAAHDALGVFGPAHVVNRDGIAASFLALDGRWPEATVGFRDAIRRMAELGLEMSRAQLLLDAAFVAPPGDAFGVDGAREARELFERMGARAFVAQVDALWTRSRPASEGRAAPPARSGLVGQA